MCHEVAEVSESNAKKKDGVEQNLSQNSKTERCTHSPLASQIIALWIAPRRDFQPNPFLTLELFTPGHGALAQQSPGEEYLLRNGDPQNGVFGGTVTSCEQSKDPPSALFVSFWYLADETRVQSGKPLYADVDSERHL